MRHNSERVAKKRFTRTSRTQDPEWELSCGYSELKR